MGSASTDGVGESWREERGECGWRVLACSIALMASAASGLLVLACAIQLLANTASCSLMAASSGKLLAASPSKELVVGRFGQLLADDTTELLRRWHGRDLRTDALGRGCTSVRLH